MKFSLAILVCLVFAGCNSTQIRDEAASAIVTLTDEERSLSQEAVQTITELVALRDSIYEELAAIAGMTDDEIIHQALEEAAERMAHGMTQRLQRLATRLQAHSKVLQVVIRQLHTIHQLALDQINIMAMLQVPLSFFGVPPFDGGAGAPVPTGPTGPTTPSSPGMPWPEIILSGAAAYATYRTGKKGWEHHKKKGKDKRLAAEREDARDKMFAALLGKIVPEAKKDQNPDDVEIAVFLKKMQEGARDRRDDPAMSSAGLDVPRNGQS